MSTFLKSAQRVILYRTRKSSHAGFTLLETVVAISILMLGVLGPLSLARQNIKASREAGDRITAAFFAQEGIEVLRSSVANASADDNFWLENIDPPQNCDATNNRCIADITISSRDTGTPLRRCNGQCRPTIYQDASGVYRQSDQSPAVLLAAGWAPTKFSREVIYITQENGKRITASTTVWWPRGNITLQEDIYNWFFPLN